MSPESKPLRNQLRALLGGAVGEALGVDPALGLLLDAVVADRRGGGEALLEVAVLEDAARRRSSGPRRRRSSRPAARAGPRARSRRRGSSGSPARTCLLDAELLLDVVADLVGDHVGLGEVAGRAEALAQLVEEAEVDVDLLVERAVEGAGRRARLAAARADAGGEEDEAWRRRMACRPWNCSAQKACEVVEDEVDELDLRRLGVGALGGPRRRRCPRAGRTCEPCRR